MCNWKGFCGHLTDVPSKCSQCFDSLSGIFVLGNNIKNINMHTILLFYILVYLLCSTVFNGESNSNPT